MMDFDFKKKIEDEEAYLAALARHRAKLRRIYYIIGFVAAFLILFTTTIVKSGNSFESWFGQVPFLGRLFSGSDRAVLGESEDRINILLIGMGGKDHDGGYLADTIILASLKPSTKQVVLFSIPRDLAIPTGGSSWQKVNSINAYAESKGEDGSLATAQALGELFEIPIHYYVRVDFDGFINVIDELGGVEIDVENVLDDYAYPIRGQEDNPNYYSRYEHLHFDKGLQEMDGELALKYARSRHAQGAEGSDFARSRRQQKILSAVKDKLLSAENLLKPGMLARIANQAAEHISTSVSVSDGLRLWKLVKDVPQENIESKVFDDGPTNFLVSSTGYDGAYILLPKTGNFGKMKAFIQTIFGDSQVLDTNTAKITIKTETANPNATSSQALVEIKNGTNIGGLAGTMSEKLKAANFTITKVGNASQRDFVAPVIYDLTYGAKEEALQVLKVKTSAEATTTLPAWLVQEIKDGAKADIHQTRPDFILILGESSNN